MAVILAHHGILPDTHLLPPLARRRHETQEFLKSQLNWLKEKKFNFVSLSTLVAHLKAPELKNMACVTFDDGLWNVFEFALPVLRAFKAPACIFLVGQSALQNKVQWTDAVEKDWYQKPGNSNREDFTELSKIKLGLRNCSLKERDEAINSLSTNINSGIGQTLNLIDLKNLDPEIFELGFHSMSHPSLLQLQEDSIALTELDMGRRELESKIGHKLKHYAYPFGEYDQLMKDRIKSFGFCSASTVNPSIIPPECDAFELGRIEPQHWEDFKTSYEKGLIC